VLIDAHTHVVGGDRTRDRRPAEALANGNWWHGQDCTVDTFAEAVEAGPVDAAVLVQAAGPYGDDNRYLIDAVAAHPKRFVAGVIVDPCAHPDPAEQLRTLAGNPHVLGVRLFHIPRPSRPWLAGPLGDALVDTAAELGLSISICCLADDLPEVARQLDRRSDLAMALDHCGFVDFSDPTPLWELATRPNLHVKFTPTCAEIAGPAEDPRRLLELVVGRLGANRVLWGSDWPQHRAYPTYAEAVDHAVSWTAGLDAAEQAAVLGGNVMRLWPEAWPQLRGGDPTNGAQL
jgi:predicted TIM-barrel fold metal-dependent hydrolase